MLSVECWQVELHRTLAEAVQRPAESCLRLSMDAQRIYCAPFAL